MTKPIRRAPTIEEVNAPVSSLLGHDVMMGIAPGNPELREASLSSLYLRLSRFSTKTCGFYHETVDGAGLCDPAIRNRRICCAHPEHSFETILSTVAEVLRRLKILSKDDADGIRRKLMLSGRAVRDGDSTAGFIWKGKPDYYDAHTQRAVDRFWGRFFEGQSLDEALSLSTERKRKLNIRIQLKAARDRLEIRTKLLETLEGHFGLENLEDVQSGTREGLRVV